MTTPGVAAPPLVSVIIPCHDHGRFLAEAVASVCAQTLDSWECLVVDDGSTDDSAAVAARLAADEPRLRVLRQPRRGCAGARNAGLDAARGRYVQFLDADDVILPGKLAAQVATLEGTPAPGLVICDYYPAPEHDLGVELPHRYLSPRLEGPRPLVDLAERWERSLSIPVHCFLFDRRLFAEIRFDEALLSHEDWDCWLRVLALDPPVRYIDQRLAVYRRYAGSQSSDRATMRWTFLRAVRQQRHRLRRDPVLREVLTRKLSQVAWDYRDAAPAAKALRVAYAAARLAGRHCPDVVRRYLGPPVKAWFRGRGRP